MSAPPAWSQLLVQLLADSWDSWRAWRAAGEPQLRSEKTKEDEEREERVLGCLECAPPPAPPLQAASMLLHTARLLLTHPSKQPPDSGHQAAAAWK